jgi:ferredoxin-NADP reductase
MLIKARGDFSASLERLAPGTPVRLDAPHGHCGLHAGRADALYLVAGGNGVSPVMGVLRHLHAIRDPRPISLLYGARNLECLCLVCGPTRLMLAVERWLLAAGVPSRQIVCERFGYD